MKKDVSQMTREERLAFIKEVHQNWLAKQQAKKDFKTKAKKSTNKAMQKLLGVKSKKEKEFDKVIDRLDENYNHYTDSDKYAKKYYGDIYSQTTRFDNEWN